MPNVATVSFKVSPEHYAVLKALAVNNGGISQLCRDTIVDALDLDGKAEQMAALFSGPCSDIRTANGNRRIGDRPCISPPTPL